MGTYKPTNSFHSMSSISIITADYTNTEHQEHIKMLLNEYAKDPMGNGEALDENILSQVVVDLQTVSGAFSLLAFYGNEPIGIANCFTAYSTFYAKPLINIHDLAVLPQSRGLGVGQKLLDAASAEATKRGCCKVTLEVRNDNSAKNLYLRAGFKEGKPPMEFLSKVL